MSHGGHLAGPPFEFVVGDPATPVKLSEVMAHYL
jgi:hypothetical protein